MKISRRLFKHFFISGNYKIIIARDKDTLDRVYQFRYEMYCIKDKLLDARHYPKQRESDEYDQYSIHFVAINREDEIIGVIRLIRSSDEYLPTEKEFDLEELLQGINPESIVEVSRFIIRHDYRKTFLLLDLMKAVFIYSTENEIKFWLGCVESWFYKTLISIFGPIRLVANPRFCFNAMNYPFLLRLSDMENQLQKKHKFLYLFLKKKSRKFYF